MTQGDKMKRLTLIYCLAMVMVAKAAVLGGKVVDQDSQLALAGVKVTLLESNHREITSEEGRFFFSNLADGKVTVQVSALGYATVEQTLELTGNQVITIPLKNEALKLESSRVRSQLQGQSKALNSQMNSDHIKNIVAADQIDLFPDQNIAEAVQRIPGVGTARDQGEGRYVLVRGTQPRLTSVKINGQEVPSPDGGARSVALDVIPSDQIASIELNKAITPEMDADAIGGQIDIILARAKDTTPDFDVSVAGGYNSEMNSSKNFEGSIGYGQRFGANGKLGLTMGAGFMTRHFGSDNVEMAYGSIDVLDSALVDEEGDPEVVDEIDAFEEIEFRDYEITRQRTSLNIGLDYRLGPASELYLQTTFNRFSDQEYRRLLNYNFSKGELYNNNMGVLEGAELERELKDRFEVQDIFMVTAGGKHLLGTTLLDYAASFSHAQEDEPVGHYTAYVGEYDLAPISRRSEFPSINAFGENVNERSNFELDAIEANKGKTTDQNMIVGTNVEFPLSSTLDWTLKTGVKLRAKTKERKNSATAYEWDVDSDAPTMVETGSATLDDSDFLNDKYANPGPMADDANHRKLLSSLRDSLASEKDLMDNYGDDYSAQEQVYAGYLQTRLETGKWLLVTGVRYEGTNLEYEGYEVNVDEETTAKIKAKNDYYHILPGAHLRYTIMPKLNARMAITQSISRPDYFDLVPYIAIEDDEIEMGNPDLKATTSSNFDLMIENYFQSVGILSAGYYFKWIENLIYTRNFEDEFRGDRFEITQQRNGTWGQIHGMELAYNHQFTFLPGDLAGLGLYSNYTYSWSQAQVPGRKDLVELPGQSKNMSNVALGFERWGFSGRLAWNLHGQYLAELGDDKDEDIWYETQSRMDLSLSQRLGKNMIVFTEVNNLLDTPLRYFQGDNKSYVQMEHYGITTMVGMKYAF
jgi:TonB-dependent receptor